MTRHIGIVACSAEGAALCYRTICNEGAQWLGPHGHPEVSMHTPPLSRYMACIDRNDWPGVGALMLDSARRLAAAGADFLICPDNTIHQAMPWVRDLSPLPWLHIAEVVAEEAQRRGFRLPALTGTRWLVDSDVYPQALAQRGLRCLRPLPQERDAMGAIIMQELVEGVFTPASTAVFLAGHRPHADGGLRRRDPGLHRDPADHRRHEFAAAHAGLDPAAGACGAAPCGGAGPPLDERPGAALTARTLAATHRADQAFERLTCSARMSPSSATSRICASGTRVSVSLLAGRPR